MNQLFGQSGDPMRSIESDLVPAAVPVRPLPVSGPEQAFFHLDVRRSLQLHGRLAASVAIAAAVLAVAYFLLHALVLKTWPSYEAESVIYVQPAPARVLQSAQGESARWPYDTNTYESYMQQQMMNVSREDVLINALHKLHGWQKTGESDQAAAERLVRSLSVDRSGTAYQFTIGARARTAQMAADVANALAAAYLESATRDQKTGDTERMAILTQERDRIQNLLDEDRAEQQGLNRQLGVASVGSSIPDHYDADISEMRAELIKARTDHDAAEAKFTSMDAGHGPSSAAIDAEADQMIAADAGLVSMKQALNLRRATLISQMANLTPSHPQYKQDEVELGKIDGDLESMMKDLRAKAAAQIQLKLQAELQRTGGVESQLNGQVRQLVGAAGSATPKMQRSSDLASDVTRLQTRFAAIDEELHNVMLENSAPASVYPVTTAVPPLTRTKSGVVRNSFLIVLAGLFFGLLAAIAAHKLDPKVYVAADVELVLGFAPMAQLPDFNEVPEGVADEFLLRLASSIEHARKQSNLRSCVFTGINEGNGVTTLVNRLRAMLEAMGRTTVLVNASGAPPLPESARTRVNTTQGLIPVERISRPTALLQQMEEETESEDEALVLTDTAPLAVSAETEYLARFVDCAIVVIESGRTTRRELRDAAATLQRLDVGAVGFVLNKVGLSKAEPAFRTSIAAIEKHLKAQGVARRAEAVNAPVHAPVSGPVSGKEPEREEPSFNAEVRAHYEPELAAVAAAVARFSSHTVHPAASPSTPIIIDAPAAEPAEILHSEVHETPEALEQTSAPGELHATGEPIEQSSVASQGPATPGIVERSVAAAPFAEAAQHFSSRAEAKVPALALDFEPFAYVPHRFVTHDSTEEEEPVKESAAFHTEVAHVSGGAVPVVEDAQFASLADEAHIASFSPQSDSDSAGFEHRLAAQESEDHFVAHSSEAEPTPRVYDLGMASHVEDAYLNWQSFEAKPLSAVPGTEFGSHEEEDHFVTHSLEAEPVSLVDESESASHGEEDHFISHSFESEPASAVHDSEPVTHAEEDHFISRSLEAESISLVHESESASHAEEDHFISHSFESEPASAVHDSEPAMHEEEEHFASHSLAAEPVSLVHESEPAAQDIEDHLVSHSFEAEPALTAVVPEAAERAGENTSEVAMEKPMPITDAEPVAESITEPKPEPEEVAAAGVPSDPEKVEPLPAAAMDLPVEPVVAAPSPQADLPSWLNQTPTRHERVRPPVLWKPARVLITPPAAVVVAPLPPTPAAQLGDTRANVPLVEYEQTVPDASKATSQANEPQAQEDVPETLTSRLSGLRNLLFVMGVKNPNGSEFASDRNHAGNPGFSSHSESSSAEVLYPDPKREATPTHIGDASPRLVTAPPEFLPPTPIVIKVDREERAAGEPHVGPGRRMPVEAIEILPFKRGQFNKL